MRTKLAVILALICLTGCSSSPSQSPAMVVKSFLAHAESGDVQSMMKLISREAIQRTGEEKIRVNNQGYSNVVKQVKAEGAKLKMEELKEYVNGDFATVSLVYGDKEKNEAAHLHFTLAEEHGEWKISAWGLIE